mmetsp:Transcript_69459/g.190668  ORF Transcript_69459/g.190668 Transcript_69459/m.190668 type:complete len:213 (-) Transcript_69459:122-760(-)
MPLPGKALVKPGVNALYKAEVRKLAQQYAAADAAGGSMPEELKELCRLVNDSGLTSERRADAHGAVRQALRKIEAGQNPCSGLNPPPGCAPCVAGQKGKTHHFFCEARSRQPGVPEITTREQIKRKLIEIYRAKQIAVEMLPAQPREPGDADELGDAGLEACEGCELDEAIESGGVEGASAVAEGAAAGQNGALLLCVPRIHPAHTRGFLRE